MQTYLDNLKLLLRSELRAADSTRSSDRCLPMSSKLSNSHWEKEKKKKQEKKKNPHHKTCVEPGLH